MQYVASDFLETGNKTPVPKMRDEQYRILEAMKEGWTLFQNKNSFNFYMKKSGTPPFRTLIGTLSKSSVIVLVRNRLIIKDHTCPTSLDFIYVIKGE